MSPALHFTVVGAGLSGLATAIALGKSGHKVLVLEKEPQLTPLGAGINLFPNATRIFEHWGILPELEEISFKVVNGILRSYRDGQPLSTGVFVQNSTNVYGTPYVVVHRASLAGLLMKAASASGAEVRMNAEVKSISSTQNDEHEITLASGDKIRTDVIIAADGERSTLRQLIGKPIRLQDSGDHVYRFTLAASQVESDPELADLCKPNNINFWVAAGGHAIAYRLREGDRYNLVYTKEHEAEAEPQLAPKVMDVKSVLPEFSDWEPRLIHLLSQAPMCVKWTLLEATNPPEWKLPGGNLCLIGDAAHSMLPYLGQGAAMAIEDAGVLGELFAEVTSKEQVSHRLEMFEAIRKPRTFQMAKGAKGIKPILMLQDGPEQVERDRRLLHEAPEEGCANFLIDPVLSKWMFAYDAVAEAKAALARDRQ